jgi:hypothetical protein
MTIITIIIIIPSFHKYISSIVHCIYEYQQNRSLLLLHAVLLNYPRHPSIPNAFCKVDCYINVQRFIERDVIRKAVQEQDLHIGHSKLEV